MRGGGAGDSRFAWRLTLQGEKKPASRVKLWDQATAIRRKRRGRLWMEERRAAAIQATPARGSSKVAEFRKEAITQAPAPRRTLKGLHRRRNPEPSAGDSQSTNDCD